MDSFQDILDISGRIVEYERFQEAIEYLTAAIENHKDAPELFDLRGISWFGLLHLEKAEKDFNTAITLDPSFHLSHFHLSELFLHQREFEIAEKHCSNAIAVEPKNLLYSATYAYLKLQLEKYNECIDICSEILNFYPAYDHALEYRADAYISLKMYDKAIVDYETLYRNSETTSILLNNLGYAYSKVPDIKVSKRYLADAIQLDPGFSYPYDNLGYVYMLEKNYKKAHELIDKSLELDPTNSYAYKNRALVFIAEGNTENALIALQKAKGLKFDLYYGEEVDELLASLKK